MVRLAQLVRASDCGSEGQGFETLISPHDLVKILRRLITQDFFCIPHRCGNKGTAENL